MLSKDELVAIGRPKVKTVNIEGVGEIGVVEISGADYTAIQAASVKLADADGVKHYKYAHVAACLVDDTGNKLFANAAEAEEFASTINNATFEAICVAIAAHNGIKETVEDAVKN